MSTRSDLDRSITTWLVAQAPERAPQRLVDVSRDRIRTTRQRRTWWPAWRFPTMNGYAKLAMAAVAVIALAFVGLNLLPSSGGPPVGGPAVSPSASPSSPASSSPSPEARTWPTGDPLEAQRYDVTVDGVPYSFAVPSANWRSVAAGELITGSGSPHTERGDDYAWVLGPEVGNPGTIEIATDPCAGEARLVDVSSLDDHAAAYANIAGTTAQEPVDVTLGGYPAKLVEFTVDPDPPCDINSFWLFGQTSLHPNSVNSIMRVWITEVDGQRYSVFADQASADPRVEREIQQIIDSIQFE